MLKYCMRFQIILEKIINCLKKYFILLGKIMIRFLLGFVSGLYVGTKYDVKPFLEKAEKFVIDNFPKKE